MLTLVFLMSCQSRHEKIMEQFDQLRSGDSEKYPIVYAYSTYLSTATDIEEEDVIPMLLELISYDAHTEARYCIDNLKANGIFSWDLLALRGLCYYNELHPELAMIDLEKAIAGDPGNGKIKALLKQVRGRDHESLYMNGLDRLQEEQYDSALHLINLAIEMEKRKEYETSVVWIEKVLEAEKLIEASPASYTGYLQKSQGLASLGLFKQAQKTLTGGLEKNPDNLNLILAKALVWVQAGQQETARKYLEDLEQQGLNIDPALKQRILQTQQ